MLGRRISRSVAGGGAPGSTNTEHYVYNGNQIIADLDENGDLIRSYTWGPGIDNLLSMTVHGATEPNTYYALKDHQNSVLAFTDSSGAIVESYECDAWGNIKVFNAADTELTESAIGNRYTFQGREIDWTTGLLYFRARWYNPETGRWLSKDPIGISGGLNLYAFCGNNPVNFVDPWGLCKKSLKDKAKELAKIAAQVKRFVAGMFGKAGTVAGAAGAAANTALYGGGAYAPAIIEYQQQNETQKGLAELFPDDPAYDHAR